MELIDMQTLVTTTVVTIVIAIGSSIWGAIKLFTKRLNVRDKQIENLLQQVKYLKEQNEKLTTELNIQHEKIEKIIQGGVALMQDRLIQSCEAFINLGYTTYIAKEQLTAVYDNFIKLGGSGIAIVLFKQFDALQVRTINTSDSMTHFMPDIEKTEKE